VRPAVPRFIPILGLIGGPLVFMVNIGKMFGLYDQIPPLLAILVLPIFAWEVTLALWLIVAMRKQKWRNAGNWPSALYGLVRICGRLCGLDHSLTVRSGAARPPSRTQLSRPGGLSLLLVKQNDTV